MITAEYQSGWTHGYGQGRDDEARGDPLRPCPDDAGQRIDGDLLKDIILDACPYWMSDEFTREFAEQILAECARSGYMTVVRGMDGEVWNPDRTADILREVIDEVLAEPEVTHGN